MSGSEQFDKQEISSKIEDQKSQLETQITQLGTRILNLQKYIITLEHANNVIEQLANNEKDGAKIKSYYAAVKQNIELLAKIFEVIKEYEGVKFKYYKEIDDIIISKYKMISIDIKKLEEKLNGSDDVFGFFERLTDALKNSGAKREQVTSELQNDPDYKL